MSCELAGNESGLLAYYKFNQGIAAGSNSTETTVFDHTSNNHDGTVNSFLLTGPVSNWIDGSANNVGGSCVSSIPEIDIIGTPKEYASYSEGLRDD